MFINWTGVILNKRFVNSILIFFNQIILNWTQKQENIKIRSTLSTSKLKMNLVSYIPRNITFVIVKCEYNRYQSFFHYLRINRLEKTTKTSSRMKNVYKNCKRKLCYQRSRDTLLVLTMIKPEV
jgi:hypothetical protein